MKRLLFIIALCIFLFSCGSAVPETEQSQTVQEPAPTVTKETETSSPDTEPAPTADPQNIPVLDGLWIHEDFTTAETSMVGKILDGVVEVWWTMDYGRSMYLYWSGTYDAPTAEGYHEWESVNNKKETLLSIMASDEETKEFYYDDGFLQFPITINDNSGYVTLHYATEEDWAFIEMLQEEEERAEAIKNAEPEYEILHSSITTWDTSYSTYAQVILAIKNTGEYNIFCDTSRFDIEHQDGTLASTIEYVYVSPQIIRPGETAYFYKTESTENLKSGEPYAMVPALDVEVTELNPIRYGTSEFKLTEDRYGNIDALGRIENTTAEESTPKIAVVLFNALGNPIGVMDGYGDEFKPGEKQGVDLSTYNMCPDVNMNTVDHFEVFAYKTQFNW